MDVSISWFLSQYVDFELNNMTLIVSKQMPKITRFWDMQENKYNIAADLYNYTGFNIFKFLKLEALLRSFQQTWKTNVSIKTQEAPRIM